MAAGDGFESWLIDGLAQHLEDAGIGTWRSDGTAYQGDEIAIVDRDMPDAPDSVIALTDYMVATPADGLADQTIGVQIRIRGTTDPRICRDLGAAIFDLLEASGNQVWGAPPKDVAVVDVTRASYTSLGRDQQGRYEASHNYYVTAMRPTIYRSE